MKQTIVEGFLLINKPVDVTSFDCIRQIQSHIGTTIKIGHTGTLDPFASGLLIIAIGRTATREVDRFLKMDKEYIATGVCGIETDSLDTTGTVIEKCSVDQVTDTTIIEAVLSFPKTYLQTPPIYSALKHEGEPLYHLIRSGKKTHEELSQVIRRKLREITIHKLKLLNVQAPQFTIRTLVSHGTYIRSLLNDIARTINSCATTTALKRTQIGAINLEDTHDLTTLNSREAIQKNIIPVAQFLHRYLL